MRSWSDLQAALQELMGEKVKVYFQPPENFQMSYPCIVFDRTTALINYADNKSYQITKRYTVTLISKTADNEELLDKLLQFPMATYDRQFIVDNLVHDVFSVYY